MCGCIKLAISCRVLIFAGKPHNVPPCTAMLCCHRFLADIQMNAQQPACSASFWDLGGKGFDNCCSKHAGRKLPQRQQPTMLRSLAASIAALIEAATLGSLASAPPILCKNCCRCASFCWAVLGPLMAAK